MKSTYTKVYRAPGYPVDPKKELERFRFEPLNFSLAETIYPFQREVAWLLGLHKKLPEPKPGAFSDAVLGL